jgi:dTMP kinase
MTTLGQSNGRGRFCVLEGLDGTGTTTLSAILAERLQARDLRVLTTAEPTEGPFGRLLRSHVEHRVDLDPHTAALAFTADRHEHLEQVIRPALRRGHWVISDRYLLSTLAYQGAEGVSREAILAASQGFDVPDVTFLLDAPDDVRRERMSSRGRVDRYEDPALALRLRASYEESAALLRRHGHRIEAVDATSDPEAIVSDLLGRLDAAGP